MLRAPISQGSRAVSEGPQVSVSSWYSGQDPSGYQGGMSPSECQARRGWAGLRVTRGLSQLCPGPTPRLPALPTWCPGTSCSQVTPVWIHRHIEQNKRCRLRD